MHCHVSGACHVISRPWACRGGGGTAGLTVVQRYVRWLQISGIRCRVLRVMLIFMSPPPSSPPGRGC